MRDGIMQTKKLPYFSIVVVCLNDKKNLLATVNSVLSQDFSDYEIIVKDGCSSDGSVSALPSDNRIHVFIEKDTGIYDAMNQGITYASGQYVQFLNCGDTLAASNVLTNIYKESLRENTSNVIYGNFTRGSFGLYKQRSQLNEMSMISGALNHQTLYFHRNLFDEYGRYETKYKVLADNDLILRLYTKNVPFQYIDIIICDYLTGGFSDSEKVKELSKKEWHDIRNTYFSRKTILYYYFRHYITLTPIRKWIVKSSRCPLVIKKTYGLIINRIKH